MENSIKTHSKSHIHFFILLLILILSSAVTASETAVKDIIVDIPWLISHQQDEALLLIDARDRKLYRAGHIPGAINIPVSSIFYPDNNKGKIGKLSYISKLFSEAGVQHGNVLVIYSGSTHIAAARVFWAFEVYGQKNVKLLNGGIDAWKTDKSLPVSTQDTQIPPSQYIPSIDPDKISSKLSMRLAVESKNKIIIDSRPTDDYNGITSKASRFGHIPTAISIPARQNLTEINGITMIKTLAELQARYASIAKNKKVYAYCNKGKESALTYVVLRQLGRDVAIYDSSWIDWANDNTLPIVNPAE